MKKIVVLLIVVCSLFSLVGCNGKKEKVDYVSKVTLERSYEGKNFFTNGIGVVTLHDSIDGDTAHFKQEGSNQIIKVRFLGVDTPESTGKIEEWGKAASNFTKEKLENANEIVLESRGNYPETDSNDRYLAWVWVDGVLLNLWLVQEGFSVGGSVEGSPYTPYLIDADFQAQAFKLHIWSNEKDELFYYGEAQLITLKELRENVKDYIGLSVRIQGNVVRRDGLNAYLQAEYEDVNYGIYVFTAYSQAVADALKVGNEVLVTGTVTTYNDSAQLTNVKYSDLYPSEDDIKILDTGNRLPAQDVNIEDLNREINPAYECTYVKLSGVRAVSGYNEYEDDKETILKAITFKVKDISGKEITIRIEDKTALTKYKGFEYFVDKSENDNVTFDLAGLVGVYNMQFQLKVVTYTDVTENIN